LLVEILNNVASIGKEINAKKTVKDGEGKGTFQKLRVLHMHVLITRDYGKSRAGKQILRSKLGKAKCNI
jgi:hypothetical protein